MPYLQMFYPRKQSIAREFGVLVIGQKEVRDFCPPPNTTLIRIQGWNPTGKYDFDKLKHQEVFQSIHEFEFDDIDFSHAEHNLVFNAELGNRVIDVFEKHQLLLKDEPKALLLIHCQGGISRSSAVACGYAHFRGNKDLEEAIRTCGYYTPNAKVYRTLVEEIERRSWENLLSEP